MSYAPPPGANGAVKLPMIGPGHPFTFLPRSAIGGTAPASAVWPTANKAFYYPVIIPAPIVVQRMWVATGATGGTNNRSLGIYTEAGVQIAVTANTLAGTANQVQFITIGPLTLGPGAYYLGISQNGTSAAVFRNAASIGATSVTTGIVEQVTAYPLPATATFADLSAGFLPIFGICTTAAP